MLGADSPGESGGRRGRGKSHGRRKRGLPIFPVLMLLLLILASGGGYVYVSRYMPSSERAELNEYFDVAGDNVQVYLNEEKQRNKKDYLVLGLYRHNHVYLPYDFVLDKLNRRFYWQEDKGVFLYTLPNETVVTGESEHMEDGSPAFFLDGKNKYLNVDWLRSYTDIRYHQNVDGEHKRIFLYNEWSSYSVALVDKREAVRLLGGVKSPVLTELERGAEVKLLERMDKWSLVSTHDGFQGYLRNSRISEPVEHTPISEFEGYEYSSISLPDDKRVELGFHQVMNAAANSNFESVTAQAAGMNVIAPTWYVISSSEGDFVSYASSEYVAAAHEKGYQVWGTVNNFDLGRIDESVFLKSMELREGLIGGLVQNALENNLDGINIDLELIPTGLGTDYVQFMRELSVACRNTGLILSVDSYVPFGFNTHYDLEELGAYCDYVIIMCYDEHYAGSDSAGSVSSISYVERGISEGMKLVPGEKLIIAVPFYTRVWIHDADGGLRSEALSIKRAKQWVEEKGVSLSWLDDIGQSYGSIDEGDTRKEIWLEDEQSMSLKLSRIRDAEVAGVAAWKLGQEPEGFWEILKLN